MIIATTASEINNLTDIVSNLKKVVTSNKSKR